MRQKNCSSNINILTLLKIFILNHFSYFFTHQEIYIIKYSLKETQSKLMASSPIWWLFVLPFCQCYICFSVLKSIKKSINIGQTHRNINIYVDLQKFYSNSEIDRQNHGKPNFSICWELIEHRKINFIWLYFEQFLPARKWIISSRLKR